jgi:hypothetical protein
MREGGGDMSERHDPAAVTSISKAHTLDEIADFWDEHNLDDYWEQTHEVEFEVSAKRRHRVTLDPDVAERVEAEARARHSSRNVGQRVADRAATGDEDVIRHSRRRE